METNQGNPDFRELCTELADSIEVLLALRPADARPLRITEERYARARAALSHPQPPAGEVGDPIGPDWQPCVKLPITVHVREQRPGETHVSTREGITPVRPDDLIMRGVQGEEYPIGRELFQNTYRLGSADEPQPPAGEVGELVAWLQEEAARLDPHNYDTFHVPDEAAKFTRAADLLKQLAQDHVQGATKIVEPTNEGLTQAYQAGRRDAEADAQQAAEAAEDEPAPAAESEVAEEPAVPSDQELYDYWISTSPEFGCANPVAFARAVLARWGSRGVSRCHRLQQENHRFREPERTILCDILANGHLLPDADGKRYGIAALQPIPVSERLPEAEDCDAKGRCWWLHVGEDGVGDWFQRAPYPSETSYAFFRMTHWLPANALPLPSVKEVDW